ncbi:tail fiber assembly protein [Providencia rettgeri]|uniref:tail fiber assembly protein n=1 Tax=Providencia rettgeri TaxID=587 RepID=UPI000BC43D3F|nr:tail fiber assembly protein [Providencia rettgeri]PCQ36990.1 hypothetical protein CQA26_15615 [Providencia rettgeri]
MIYFKDSQSNVFAYPKTDIEQTKRLSELELLIQTKEPEFIQACNKQQNALDELNEVKEKLAVIIFNGNNDVENENNEEIQHLNLVIKEKETKLEEAKSEYDKIESEYQPLKNEYSEILPVFFNIRENLKVLTKMTTKEVETHINPPVPKEQLIADAEIQKQSCADDAEKNITILERKVRLNMATDDDKNNLTAWEIYSIKVSDIDTSTAPDIEWPVKP